MENLIVRVIAMLLFLASSLTGCFNSEKPELWVRSYTYDVYKPYVSGELKADQSVFDINDVTVDFYYSLYCLDDEQDKEEVKSGLTPLDPNIEWAYAIYLSNNEYLEFEMDDGDFPVIDYKNKVNANLIKHFTWDEAFESDYGYTVSRRGKQYRHNEKLTIPAEYFAESNGFVYIHIVMITRDTESNRGLRGLGDLSTIKIEYKMLDENTVILYD